MTPKQHFQDSKFLFYGFHLRKSGKLWSVDQKRHGIWDFMSRGTKKDCVSYIETRISQIQAEKA